MPSTVGARGAPCGCGSRSESKGGGVGVTSASHGLAAPCRTRSDSAVAPRHQCRPWRRHRRTRAAVAAAGYLVTQFGIAVADRTGLDDITVGGLRVATVTSMPELDCTVTAGRRGALTLLSTSPRRSQGAACAGAHVSPRARALSASLAADRSCFVFAHDLVEPTIHADADVCRDERSIQEEAEDRCRRWTGSSLFHGVQLDGFEGQPTVLGSLDE